MMPRLLSSVLALTLGLAFSLAQDVNAPPAASRPAASAPRAASGTATSLPALPPGTRPANWSAPGTQPARTAKPATSPVVTTAQALTIDGRTIAGRLTAVGPNGLTLAGTGGQTTLALRELWVYRQQSPDDLMNTPGKAVVVLNGAGELALSFTDITLTDGRVKLASPLGAIDLDMGAVRYVVNPVQAESPAELLKRHRDIRLPAAKNDYLLAEDKGNLMPLAGLVKGISGGKVVFEFDKADRTIDLGTVRVIELAAVGEKPQTPAGQVLGADGSVLPFDTLEGDGRTLKLASPIVKAALNSPAIAEIRLRSDRLTYLSDLAPAKVAEAGLFDTTFPWRRDRSAAGRPLRLCGVTYAKGLGLHSRCELTYNLDGQYAAFAATVGLDDHAGLRGDAQLRLMGDGKELAPPIRLVGGEAGQPVRCDLTGVKQFVILADFGQDNLDVSDYVDLIDARLIKP